MTASIDRSKIRDFLLEMRMILSRENSFHLVERDKNLQALEKLEYTIYDAKTVLLSLTVNDYVKGPEPDDNPNFPGEIWVFGTTIGDTELYIKIKIAQSKPHRKQVVCISFHD